MSVSSLSSPPSLARVFSFGHARPFQAYDDLEALLIRMRRRLYPETLPVLASYWLKTVYCGGHNRAWWAELNEQLSQVLREQHLDALSREALCDIQTWIQHTVLIRAKTPHGQRRLVPPFR